MNNGGTIDFIQYDATDELIGQQPVDPLVKEINTPRGRKVAHYKLVNKRPWRAGEGQRAAAAVKRRGW